MTRGFGVFFDLHLNKRLSKQSWGWWFEAPSRLLWRHGMETLSAILTFCEEIHWWISPQRAKIADIILFLCCYPEQAVEQTVKLPSFFLRYDAKMTYVKWNVCLDIQGQWVSEWEDIGTRGQMFTLGAYCWNAPQRITGIRLCFMTNCVACHNLMLPHIDGSVQDCSISIANSNALEILQSCTKPSIGCHHPLYTLTMEWC